MAGVPGDSGKSGRAGRNIVKVENDDGRLRLRFTHGGKRYAIALGLPDSKVNRTVAQQRATQIELDIVSGNFDSSLKKYQPQRGTSQKLAYTTAVELFEKFMQDQEKTKGLYAGSLCRYTATLRHLERYFQNNPAESISDVQAEEFAAHLRKQVSTRTAKDYLILVQACWKWAGVKYGINLNPWSGVLSRVKPTPKQKVKPFTVKEVQAVLAAFATDCYYHPYADFVSFLFGTGCRFGEAAALKWKHIADDCSTVWIGESVSRGVRKTTKTGKDRIVTLTPKIMTLLQEQKPINCDPESLVFPAPSGKPINDHTFRRRAWKTILTRLGIDYRKPYSTRHTAISHTLANGANPLAVAEATGHDPQILFKHYASIIQRTAVMVEF